MSDGRRRPVSSIVGSSKRPGPRQRSSASAKVPDEDRHPMTPEHDHKVSLPSNIRYEFENALQGLCDVWFKEIKPNLVRNKVKIRVHERTGEGDHGSEECSHLEPGSDSDRNQRQHAPCVSCSTKLHRASTEQSRRQRAPRSPPAPPPPLTPKPDCKKISGELTAKILSYREPVKPTALIELFIKSRKGDMCENINNPILSDGQRISPRRYRSRYSPPVVSPTIAKNCLSPANTSPNIVQHSPTKILSSPKRSSPLQTRVVSPSPPMPSTIVEYLLPKTNTPLINPTPEPVTPVKIPPGRYGDFVHKRNRVPFISTDMTDHRDSSPPLVKASGSDNVQNYSAPTKSKEVTTLYENDNYVKTCSLIDEQSEDAISGK